MSADQKFVTTRDPGGRSIAIVPVVNPEGVIKYARVSPVVQSALVEMAEDPYADRRPGAPAPVTVNLKPGLAQKGWALLADLFHQENRDLVWGRFREWMIAGPMVTDGGQVESFPERYLPEGVKMRRSRRATHQAAPLRIEIPELDDEGARADVA